MILTVIYVICIGYIHSVNKKRVNTAKINSSSVITWVSVVLKELLPVPTATVLFTTTRTFLQMNHYTRQTTDTPSCGLISRLTCYHNGKITT